MNLLKVSLFVMTFGSFFIFGQSSPLINSSLQKNVALQNKKLSAPVEVAQKESAIIGSTNADSAFLKIQLLNAAYDASKNNLPYYGLSKTTSYDQSAKPLLVIKKVMDVVEPHASIIKKYFSKFLTGNFEIQSISSVSRNENLNHHQLFPFRLNSMQQVEELVDFDVNWQLSGNNNRALRTAAAHSFSTSSVLASGTWYKIGLTQTGVYTLDKKFLTKMGIDLTTLDPHNLRVYGNGGKMLPEMNGSFRYDDLVENSIFVFGEADGVFNDSDYVAFYATGTTEWSTRTSTSPTLKYSAIKNLYSDTSFYFLNADLGSGKRVVHKPASDPTLIPNTSSTTYDYYNFHEQDEVNFVKSGKQFYGEYFDLTTSYGFNWSDGDFVTGDSLLTEVSMAARSASSSVFQVVGSGANYNVITSFVDVTDYLADYAAVKTSSSANLLSSSSNNVLSFTINKLSGNSLGWLDKITVNARRRLKVGAQQFSFRDRRVAAPGKICQFSINTATTPTLTIWNVTNPLTPFLQDFNTVSGTTLDFTCTHDSLNEFCIVPASDLYQPKFIGKVVNQNLHALGQADYVIIAYPTFVAQAQRLAQLHQQNEGLTYAIATTDEIYNEFSSGRQDASALRDFIRMFYSRYISTGKQVKYALLMGDGSYKNRDRSLVNNSDLIPTYQSQNSVSFLSSVATDDFYAMMDPSDGVNADMSGAVDVGVGRFTCRSVADVSGVIGKIETYYKKDGTFKASDLTPENCNNLNESNMGDWRNWMIFLADDGDNALHMGESNELTQLVDSISPVYNADKVFLDSYKSISTPGGKRYPDATAEFLKRINKGAFLFNYTGHGGETGLAAEQVLDVPTINALQNINTLPLFVTATCEFSRYDDPDRTSAGELCLLNAQGGAIALFTTCRVAYSQPNFDLNRLLLKKLLAKNPDGTRPALGDVVRATKASRGQTIYWANFHLLGDPALVMAYPQERVSTSKINNIQITNTSSDTLGALSKMTFTGFVTDTLGNKLTNFNGLVYSSVFDKKKTITCLVNDPSSSIASPPAPPVPFQFNAQKNILYRAKSLVTNGDFSFTFIVPKDISFAPGQGRISYYATNGLIDASGSYTRVVVGGTSAKNVIVDNIGPQMSLYLNDKNFINGGTTNEKPILYADLTDSSGINTSGNGIGHDISVVLDASGNNPVLLNDYYESNLNSYQSGRVRYPFSNLSEGDHRITFKVWDIQDNSSTGYSDFVVAQSAELALKHVLNYPNPFTTHTKFFFEYNQACQPIRVIIEIFTVTGKVVKTLQVSLTCEGFRPPGIDWDGKDDYGDKLGKGVYIYKLAILDIHNKKAEKIEKLVILN